MKKIILILTIGVTLLACSSSEDRAKNAIEKYLKKDRFEVASDLEIIKWSSLDTVFTKFSGTMQGGGLNSEIKKQEVDLYSLKASLQLVEFRNASAAKKIEYTQQIQDQIALKEKQLKEMIIQYDDKSIEFVPKIHRWEMKVKYTAIDMDDLSNTYYKKFIFYNDFRIYNVIDVDPF